MARKLALLAILSLLSFLFPLSSSAEGSRFEKLLGGRDFTLPFEVDGVRRTCTFHLPKGFDRSKRYPLVLVFHGRGGTGANFARRSGFREISDAEGFIVAFPDGLGRRWVTPSDLEDAADIAFVDEIVAAVLKRIGADDDRIYACGFSAGGNFTLRLAAARADRFAAVASVSGFAYDSRPELFLPGAPLSVMLVHGTADEVVPYSGGRLGGRSALPGILGAERLFDAIADAVGCTGKTEKAALPDADPADGVKVEVLSRRAGDSGPEVVLYRLAGGGHRWPSKAAQEAKGQCRDFDAASEIWRFFSRHRRPSSPNVRRNVSYGPHARNVLDLYLPPSPRAKKVPCALYVHGGAFLSGDKSSVRPDWVKHLNGKGVAVASVNYRYSTQAPYPAPMMDVARAVQYLRAHADEYGLDPGRFAAWGGSAGAVISMWLAFHDDLADPRSPDPVARFSTRLAAAGSMNGQTTMDPWKWEELYGYDFFKHPAFVALFRTPRSAGKTPEALRLFADASPVEHLDAGDPPVYLLYTQPDRPPRNMRECIHHPRFGKFIAPKLDELGVEYWLVVKDERPVHDGKPQEPGSQPGILDWLAAALR